MATKCETVKEVVTEVEESSELREKEQKKYWKENKNVSTFLNYSEKDQLLIEDKLSGETYNITNESKLNEVLNDMYGRHNERAVLASKLVALMDGNERLTEWAERIILTHLPKGEKRLNFESGKLHLDQITLSTLKNIAREFLIITESGDGSGLAKGLYGNLVVPLLTPRELSKHESAGSLYIIQKATARYHPAVSKRISDFMHSPVTHKSKRNYGMADVYLGVEALAYEMPKVKVGSDELRRKLVDIFSRIMVGQIYFEKKTGQLMIYEDWKPTGKKYLETEDNIYAWMNPVPLSEYTPRVESVSGEVTALGEKGSMSLPFTNDTKQKSKSQLKHDKQIRRKLFKLASQARKIDNEMNKYIESHLGSSINAII